MERQDGGRSGAKNTAQVRSLTRGLLILECFDENHLALSLTDIVEKTGLSVSTVSRLLQTLVQMEYLVRDPHKRYRPGKQVYRLMNIFTNTDNIRSAALPILETLRDIYNETAGIYIVRDDMRICLESVQSHQALRRAVEMGEMLPLSRGAVGYVLLAWLPYAKRTRIAKENPALNEALFSSIRKAGYVINDGEHEPGVFAIAAPVFDGRGGSLAALAVSGPSHRIHDEMRKELVNAIQTYSRLLSKSLGFGEPR